MNIKSGVNLNFTSAAWSDFFVTWLDFSVSDWYYDNVTEAWDVLSYNLLHGSDSLNYVCNKRDPNTSFFISQDAVMMNGNIFFEKHENPYGSVAIPLEVSAMVGANLSVANMSLGLYFSFFLHT